MAHPVESPSWRKGVAEFVGTFALIYIGVLVLSVGGGGKHLVEVALAHGLVIAVMVSATMSISGGQLNPAVTLGLLVGRKISVGQAGVNIAAQLLGGIVGGFAARASLAGVDVTGFAYPGVPDLAPGVSLATGILVEAILTFFLVFVVFGTGVDPRFGARIGGLAIGFTVALDILAGGPITGAAMNPARWLGAAVPFSHYANGLVYIIGPIVGGILAGLLYTHLLLDPERPHPEPQAQMRPKDNP